MTACNQELMFTDRRGGAKGFMTVQLEPTESVHELARELPGDLAFFGDVFSYLLANDARKAVRITHAVRIRKLETEVFPILPIMVPRLDELWWVPTITDGKGKPTGVKDPDLKE
jgi:hypothetical protein